MTRFHEVASGLRFPEGPIALGDGAVLVVEMFGQRLTRVEPDGSTQTIAEIPGGPNGAAMGPDGVVYVANNGGRFSEIAAGGRSFPGPTTPGQYIGGRIQTVDVASGEVSDLYSECDGNTLIAPNDLVFDAHGGFYFTDHGNAAGARTMHYTGIYYARNDGSAITEIVFPVHEPNGIGLSPDGSVLYWAETWMGRVSRRRIVAPGVVEPLNPADPRACLHGLGGLQLLDSLAVDADGNVCVATLGSGGITVISPAGALIEFIACDDVLTTNIAFGGAGLRTAFVTLSSTGRVVSFDYPRGGLPLEFLHK